MNATLGPRLKRILDFEGYSLRRPALSSSDEALERRKADIQRTLRVSAARADRIGAILDIGGVEEALMASWMLANDLFRLVCLAYGVAPRPSRGGFPEPWSATNDTSVIPDGELRGKMDALLAQLQAAKAEASAVEACVATELQILRHARELYREKRGHDLRTALDRYKRHFALTALGVLLLVFGPGGIAFAFYRMNLPRITIVEATYGGNCTNLGHPVGAGNVTEAVALVCNGSRGGCKLPITGWQFGDPAPLCAKEFRIVWTCAGDSARHVTTVPPEAMGQSAALSCSSAR